MHALSTEDEADSSFGDFVLKNYYNLIKKFY